MNHDDGLLKGSDVGDRVSVLGEGPGRSAECSQRGAGGLSRAKGDGKKIVCPGVVSAM